MICMLENDATPYRHNKSTIDSTCGFKFVDNIESLRIATIDGGFAFVNDIESINLNFIAGCFLVGVWFLGHGGSGLWFPNDPPS